MEMFFVIDIRCTGIGLYAPDGTLLGLAELQTSNGKIDLEKSVLSLIRDCVEKGTVSAECSYYSNPLSMN